MDVGACVLRGNEGCVLETGSFAQVDVVLSVVPCPEVSVLSLWTGRDETSWTGDRDKASCFFCRRPRLRARSFWLFEDLFFFFFFFLFFVYVQCLFWILGVGLGLVCCGRMRIGGGNGFLLQNNVVLSL